MLFIFYVSLTKYDTYAALYTLAIMTPSPRSHIKIPRSKTTPHNKLTQNQERFTAQKTKINTNTPKEAIHKPRMPVTVDMNDLLTGGSVTITAKPSPTSQIAYTIIVPRALVCGASEHFRMTFNGAFLEGQERAATLGDVEPWILRVFGGWLYDHKVEYREDGQASDALADIVGRDAELHENVAADPVTWSWEALFAVYQFADQYSTKELRQAVFYAVQTKLLQLRPRVYHLPRLEAVTEVVSKLPKKSPLRQLLAYVYANAGCADFHKYGKSDIGCLSAAEMAAALPIDFLAECFKIAQDGDSLSLSEMPWCWLHEHEGRDEEVECNGVHAQVAERVTGEMDEDDEDQSEVDEGSELLRMNGVTFFVS